MEQETLITEEITKLNQLGFPLTIEDKALILRVLNLPEPLYNTMYAHLKGDTILSLGRATGKNIVNDIFVSIVLRL